MDENIHSYRVKKCSFHYMETFHKMDVHLKKITISRTRCHIIEYS